MNRNLQYAQRVYDDALPEDIDANLSGICLSKTCLHIDDNCPYWSPSCDYDYVYCKYRYCDYRKRLS